METDLDKVAGELVAFRTADGLPLNGFLIRSKRRRGICIIHVHGMESNFYRNKMALAMGRFASRKGVSFFAINTRGHDHMSSFWKRTKRGDVPRMLGTALERFEDCVLDIDAAIKTMRGEGLTKVILSGHSTGSQKIAYYQYRRGKRSVKGVIFLSPGDDYEGNKRDLGKKWSKSLRLIKKLSKSGKGNTIINLRGGIAARRFLSDADLANVESRLFNYEGRLKELRKIKVPVLAVIGEEDAHLTKPSAYYIGKLRNVFGPRLFSYSLIKGAGHSFYDHEDEVARSVGRWLAKTGNI